MYNYPIVFRSIKIQAGSLDMEMDKAIHKVEAFLWVTRRAYAMECSPIEPGVRKQADWLSKLPVT